MKIQMDDVVPGHRWIGGGSGDAAFQCSTSGAVPTQRLVQAVARPVFSEIKVHRRDGRAVPKQSGLPSVELQGLIEQRCVELVDRGAGHQFLHHHHGVPYLRRELDRRGRKPRRARTFLYSQRPGSQIFQAGVRPPLQNRPATAALDRLPVNEGCPDFPTHTRTFDLERYAVLGAQPGGETFRIELLSPLPTASPLRHENY